MEALYRHVHNASNVPGYTYDDHQVRPGVLKSLPPVVGREKPKKK